MNKAKTEIVYRPQEQSTVRLSKTYDDERAEALKQFASTKEWEHAVIIEVVELWNAV